MSSFFDRMIFSSNTHLTPRMDKDDITNEDARYLIELCNKVLNKRYFGVRGIDESGVYSKKKIKELRNQKQVNADIKEFRSYDDAYEYAFGCVQFFITADSVLNEVKMNRCQKVIELKHYIQTQFGFKKMNILFHGIELEDHGTLNHYNIQDGVTLEAISTSKK